MKIKKALSVLTAFAMTFTMAFGMINLSADAEDAEYDYTTQELYETYGEDGVDLPAGTRILVNTWTEEYSDDWESKEEFMENGEYDFYVDTYETAVSMGYIADIKFASEEEADAYNIKNADYMYYYGDEGVKYGQIITLEKSYVSNMSMDDVPGATSSERIISCGNGKWHLTVDGEDYACIEMYSKTPTKQAIEELEDDTKEVLKDVTDKGVNFLSAGLNNTAEELVDICLTAEDKEALANGTPVNVWLETKDITHSVSAEDKALAENAKPAAFCTGPFVDINLYKQIGDNGAVKITELLGGKVSVSLKIPEYLKKAGRDFSVIQIHGGVATDLGYVTDKDGQLKATGNVVCGDGSLRFVTGQFSTYVITYKDAEETVSPKTGSVSYTFVYFAMAVSLGAGLVVANRKRER